MAPTATATTSSTTTSTTIHNTRPAFARSLRRPATTASTPDLNSVYASQSRLVPPGLSRKVSLAALTTSSLASIPDVSESYALDSVLSDSPRTMVPATPLAEDIVVGDAVDVPGGMHGTVRFVGAVQGKKGAFAGVELHPDFAPRGKNSGDVDGISYFATTVPGAGIFLPVAKASRRGSPVSSSMSSFPMTPTPTTSAGMRNGMTFTPPTPGLPKFSASVGPGARASSPQGKRPRTSLPRPDSPVRRTQMTPGPRPSIGVPAKVPARYGSPPSKFAQSVRGTAGDPSKKVSRLDHKPSIGPRSASALGSAPDFDDETTPVGFQRTKTNGSVGSVSSLNVKMPRPASRANAANDEEIDRLRSQLEERDRQLRDQGSTLTEMESSLVELQTLMEHPDGLRMRSSSMDDKDSAQLRHMLREKNDKIAMLTAEFDAHRADFRSTIDTLEMASTETERVYEKRIEEIMVELRELESRNLDVDSVASQLKQLEELVQELEEGLEDARRGEAEARGEAEFLRGEVERTRTELRRERDKAGSGPGPHGDNAITSKELEQKEDEIRGLKAIIHSLSRDSVPGGDDRHHPQRSDSLGGSGAHATEHKLGRDSLERQVAELQAVLEKKMNREAELEQELEMLRGGGFGTQRNSKSGHRSSLRDSRDTVIPVRTHEPRSPPEATHKATHKRGNTLDTMHESDTYSTATETSTLWCEICETSGHDILTCTNMFGPDGAKNAGELKTGKNVVREGLKPLDTDGAHPAPLFPTKPKTPMPATTPAVKILPNPMESGPVAGKESGVMDPDKWCAVCERDGHDSVDCPFEDAF
ncbi:Tip elongation protein 1 [Tolypocladium capitatum]|uniref:Tip elongation protein 1 n=1 Tax=Tolypocladium capitatum TaxID=45235 RepID=A0A2K3QLK6_9HYPO|nr:Tip elongation protein 1 [Tolypocladium capitatum]